MIGQAPPAQEQEIPYDTTMMYEWLQELGITKEQAQDMFEWDAVYDMFTGYNWSGNHKTPTQQQMNDYWERGLKEKVEKADKIWTLGRVAEDFLIDKIDDTKEWYSTMHPSTRNRYKYQLCKDNFINGLKDFINK